MVAVSLHVLVLVSTISWMSNTITGVDGKHIQTAAFHRISTWDQENTTCLAVCGREIWCSVAHGCLREASNSISSCCTTSQQKMEKPKVYYRKVAQDSGTTGEVSTASVEDPTTSATLDQRHTGAVFHTNAVSTGSVRRTPSVSGTVTRNKNPTAGLKLTSGASWRKLLETGKDGTVVYDNRSNLLSCNGNKSKRKVVLTDKGTVTGLSPAFKDTDTPPDKIGPHFCASNQTKPKKTSGRRVFMKITKPCTNGCVKYTAYYKNSARRWKECSVKMAWFAFNCPLE